MRKFTAIALFLLGVLEVVFGLVFGPLYLYAAEPSLADKLGIRSMAAEQQHIYHSYFLQFQRAWFIVAGFGVLTIAASVILGRRVRTHDHTTA